MTTNNLRKLEKLRGDARAFSCLRRWAPVPAKSVNPCFPQGDSRALAQASNKLELKYDIIIYEMLLLLGYPKAQVQKWRLKAQGSQPDKNVRFMLVEG